MEDYFHIRMTDSSSFFSISDRIDIKELGDSNGIVGENPTSTYNFNLYRGDCYICQYSQRINRNFNDPSVPYNDDIVDENTWKDHYEPDDTEKY
mgnify:FL=1